jgi:hypothetical protein
VRVPKLEGTTTTLRMYFHIRGETVAVNPHDVWKYAGYKGVWHFSGSNKESAIGLTCNNSATAPTYTEPGPVGTAFNSVTNTTEKRFVTVVNDSRWAKYGSDLTLSCWVQGRKIPGTGRIFSSKTSYSNEGGFEFTFQYGYNKYNTITSGNNQNTITGMSCENTFVYMTSVMSGNRVTLYSNGEYSGKSDNKCQMVPPTVNMRLGAVGGGNSSPGGVWDGMLDEMRLKWGNSSADWVAADYATQHDANFAVLGEIEDVNTHGTTILIR